MKYDTAKHLLILGQMNADADPDRMMQFWEQVVLEQPGWGHVRADFYGNKNYYVSQWLLDFLSPYIHDETAEIPPLPQPLVREEDYDYWEGFVLTQRGKSEDAAEDSKRYDWHVDEDGDTIFDL